MKRDPDHKTSSPAHAFLFFPLMWAVTPVMAAIYPIENPDPNSTLGGQGGGQTFSPSDAAGYSGEANLYLTSFTMWRGGSNNASTQTSPETYLVIYDGNPDSATQVGASSNFVDTANTGGGTRYDWTFDHLKLDPDTQYWAVLSNNPVDDNVLQNNGGTWLQMSLQTSDDNYAGTDEWAIIANRNPHNNEAKPDLRFMATFDTAPTPGLEIASGDTLFGELFHAGPGSSSSRTIVVRNSEAGVPLTLDAVNLEPGAAPVFSISAAPAPGTIIQPGGEFRVEVTATGGGGGLPLGGELLIDINEAGYDRRLPLAAVIRTTGDPYPLLDNGSFESGLDAWVGEGALVPGTSGGNALRIRGTGDDRANPSSSFAGLAGQGFSYGRSEDFSIRFSLVIPDFQGFTGLFPEAGFLDRSFQFALMADASVGDDGEFGDDDAGRTLVNLAYLAAGVQGDPGEGFFLFNGQTHAYERVGSLGTLLASTGFSETGELPATTHAYQITIDSRGFGKPGASYDISVSEPNSTNIGATATGLTTWHGLNPEENHARSLLFTTRDTSADGSAGFAPIHPSFWIADVSATLAEVLPLPLFEVVEGPGRLLLDEHSRETVPFIIQNVGIGSDLVLNSWSASDPRLSLTPAATLPATLRPGESVELPVQIDALDVSGDLPINESIQLSTTDPVNPSALLPVTARVLADGRRILVDYDDGIPGNGIHESSLRNGGFEDGSAGDSHIDTPRWHSRYTPEADNEPLVFSEAPADGSLHGRAGGEQGSGLRVQPAQTFSFEEWTLAAGDTFRVDVTWKSDAPLTGGGGLQVRIVAIDENGETIPSPSGKGWANSPRLISSTADLDSPGVYQTDTFFTEPVPAGDPWIGGRVELWLSNSGNRDEFIEIDNVRFIGILPRPALQLTGWSIEPATGSVMLRWPDVGRRYRIEGSPNLDFSSPSFTIDANEANGMVLDGAHAVFEFTDPGVGDHRFWRVTTY